MKSSLVFDFYNFHTFPYGTYMYIHFSYSIFSSIPQFSSWCCGVHCSSPVTFTALTNFLFHLLINKTSVLLLTSPDSYIRFTFCFWKTGYCSLQDIEHHKLEHSFVFCLPYNISVSTICGAPVLKHACLHDHSNHKVDKSLSFSSENNNLSLTSSFKPTFWAYAHITTKMTLPTNNLTSISLPFTCFYFKFIFLSLFCC